MQLAVYSARPFVDRRRGRRGPGRHRRVEECGRHRRRGRVRGPGAGGAGERQAEKREAQAGRDECRACHRVALPSSGVPVTLSTLAPSHGGPYDAGHTAPSFVVCGRKAAEIKGNRGSRAGARRMVGFTAASGTAAAGPPSAIPAAAMPTMPEATNVTPAVNAARARDARREVPQREDRHRRRACGRCGRRHAPDPFARRAWCPTRAATRRTAR